MDDLSIDITGLGRKDILAMLGQNASSSKKGTEKLKVELRNYFYASSPQKLTSNSGNAQYLTLLQQKVLQDIILRRCR